jgi:small subunit ribosomal protein S6
VNTYEGMFIINPQLSDEETAKIVSFIQDEITKNGGKILQVQIMGKQHLAYPIKKFKEGHYLLLNFSGDGKLIQKILPKYRINENIIRNLILSRKAAAIQAQPQPVAR